MTWKLFISKLADEEIEHIWNFGYEKFGLQVANNYDLLINQALIDLKENPIRLGTKDAWGFDEKLLPYHIKFSNKRAGRKIKYPRHAIYYFFVNNTIAIASISRDTRERHIVEISYEKILREIEKKLID